MLATATTYRLTINLPNGVGPQGHTAYRQLTLLAIQEPGEDLALAFDRAVITAGYSSYMAHSWEVAS